MQRTKHQLFRDLGETIRRHRTRLRMSQQEVADLAGVSVNLIRQIEAGKSTVQLTKLIDTLTAVGLQLDLVPGSARLRMRAK